MPEKLSAALRWLLDPESSAQASGEGSHLWVRWIFLRSLGLLFFSAFLPLLYEIRGMLGPTGILPIVDYLQAVAAAMHTSRFWFARTLLSPSAGDKALLTLCWVVL